MAERRRLTIEGVVQGVGFRPYVHRLASANNLRGFVRNTATGVLVDVEGERARLDAFCTALPLTPPPLSTIRRVQIETPARQVGAQLRDAFCIVESDVAGSDVPTETPVDTAPCDECLAELCDPGNRRFGHPFINCTNCGPRFTIVGRTPYDRARTSMSAFAMCDECVREYNDPSDRRFHAEAIACWACGPVLQALTHSNDRNGTVGAEAVATAAAALVTGQIVAIKALGGYHLACDATNATSVERLRLRKHRLAKPLAVMVRDSGAADALCRISPSERELLESPARAIVLLERRPGADIAPAVAPGQKTLGVMLPTTPLHEMLLAMVDRPLVMTSGNVGDEPVAIDEPSAFLTLGNIADLFIVHNRAILTRCDDSVVQIAAGDVRMIRRARGYAPRAVALAREVSRTVLALGGHLKNTVCLVQGAQASLSPHVGDLGSASSRVAMQDAVRALLHARGASPDAMAHDLHPEYASTALAETLASELGIPCLVAVQHHHAHIASCVAEHGVREPVIGVAFDGAGLGTDGAVWGGEFLLVAGATFTRCGHLSYVPLPGGDASARRPWRAAASHLVTAGESEVEPPGVDAVEWRLVTQLLARPERLPQTSSAGRLFDAVASILGVSHVSRYEGEAAMRLESVADIHARPRYDVAVRDGAPWTVDCGSIVRAVHADFRSGADRALVAGAFHRAVADAIVLGCERVRSISGVATVALSGGVFMNALLLSLANDALVGRGFRVLMHRHVPCNDGGLSLGQAYVTVCTMEQTPCV
jgi:hydrogenase maturation protein HypF